MACFYPKTAFRTSSGEIVFAERGDIVAALKLPCSQCIGCRLERSRQWATRCMHEATAHRENCFITLTYSDEFFEPSLNYSHFQKFIKRFRKNTKAKIRFYMAGEYGGETGRPHFHACIFGFDFPDKELLSERPDGNSLYRSALLETLWPFGYSSIGQLTFESAAYVARYCMKKVTGPSSDDHYWSVNPLTGEAVPVEPEFNRMSLKPGIGGDFYKKYRSDIYPNGTCVINGRHTKPPRYYEKLYKREEPLIYENLTFERLEKFNKTDNTPERREVKAAVVAAKLKSKMRAL